MPNPMFIRVLLKRIPAKVRAGLLVTFGVLVVLSWVLQVFEVPLPWDKIEEILLAFGLYLGVQSGANLSPDDNTDWFDPADYEADELETIEE